MKNYRTLALRELFAQKMTSLLILTAIILSTMMTAVIAQSAGILSAMRQQQAITLGGNRHASFVQRTGEEVKIMQQDPRLSFVGTYIQLGSSQLNRTLRLSLLEQMVLILSTVLQVLMANFLLETTFATLPLMTPKQLLPSTF